MDCPECNRNVIFPSQAVRNIESYGDNWLNIKCDKCKATLHVYGSLHVRFTNPQVTTKDADWEG